MTPRRVSPLVALAFGMGVAAAIMLTGPLLLFAPPFVSVMQARHDVARRLGSDRAAVDRATAAMLADVLVGGDFTVSLDGGEPVLDASERSHMRDVSGVVRGLLLADLAALLVVGLAGWRLRSEPARRGRLMLMAAGGIGAAALVLGAFFAFAFDAAFTAFHAIFFAAGTWQFGPDSNLLRFFPEPFWSEVALVAGATIVLSALGVALVAWRQPGRRAASA